MHSLAQALLLVLFFSHAIVVVGFVVPTIAGLYINKIYLYKGHGLPWGTSPDPAKLENLCFSRKKLLFFVLVKIVVFWSLL